MKNLALFTLFIFMTSCNSTKTALEKSNSKTEDTSVEKTQILQNSYAFLVTAKATDKDYGYTPDKPAMVGGVNSNEGPTNERRFLNALAGPNGEELEYYRAGSCCPMKSKNGFKGVALLDKYRVYYKGSKDTLDLYINMYDSRQLYIPSGLTARKF
ncbi:2-dehydro-3-deoxyphosphooctonate aldolase [Nonlabens sp. MIC269]|uniref:hypothetical protein n=1 Tax=Nonlabens sp. MIC269 TaxID=1476901 RepID=UPI000720300B|nr:hypothetical protein [Nonlabens sp. MIC269]ALM20574.1 2-dehydro-3-deoxyphosphooctonate aldolase [Nonlabens sp. MIC269]